MEINNPTAVLEILSDAKLIESAIIRYLGLNDESDWCYCGYKISEDGEYILVTRRLKSNPDEMEVSRLSPVDVFYSVQESLDE